MDPPPDVPPGAEDEDPSPSEVEDEGNGIDSVDEIDFSEEKMKEPCIKSMADLENHLVTFKLEVRPHSHTHSIFPDYLWSCLLTKLGMQTTCLS